MLLWEDAEMPEVVSAEVSQHREAVHTTQGNLSHGQLHITVSTWITLLSKSCQDFIIYDFKQPKEMPTAAF